MIGVQSMTGFSSAKRETGDLSVTCDIRSVNNKGLDIRLRMPAGLEPLETAIKKRVSEKIARGSLQIFITVAAAGGAAAMHVDGALFRSLAEQARKLAEDCGIAPPTTDGLLAVRGVVAGEDADGRVDPETCGPDVLIAIDDALDGLAAVRRQEGETLRTLLSAHVDQIEELTEQARTDPANQPAAIHERLATQIEALLRDATAVDPARLSAEAALLATKADIREEADRLQAHVDAVRKLLNEGGAVGRKLDFLAQEFNREANTICSKAASAGLTSIGLDLKAVIDQFREQVQNLQ